MAQRTQRPGLAFVVAAAAVGLAYAVASQKLNVRSAVASGAKLLPIERAELLLPSAPEGPERLFRWRVNDMDVFTPVPMPIADTLGYHSVIAFNAAFEKCSTAPLPCTPYLPGRDVKLRRPASGLTGGFIRSSGPDLAGRTASCIGELTPAIATPQAMKPTPIDEGSARCGASTSR